MVVEFYNLEDKLDRIKLNIFIYLAMLMYIAFFILTIGCFFYQTEIKNQIKAQAVFKSSWGTKDWSTVANAASSYMYTLGSIGILIIICIHYILNFLFKVLGKFDFCQILMKFICVIFYLLGFMLLYGAVYADKYKDVAKVDKAMPSWISTALYGIAIACIVIGVAGFVTAYTENKHYLKYFAIFMAFYSVLILIFSIYGAVYSNQFRSYYENKCYSIIDYINVGYLQNYSICAQKYDFNSTILRNISSTCPKLRVTTIWEINLGVNLTNQRDLYGCFDYQCCLTLYAFILSKIQYAVLVAFILFLTGVFQVLGSLYMWFYVDAEGGKRETNRASYIIMAVIAAATFIIIIIFVASIPSPPTPQPNQNFPVSAAPANNTVANPVIIIPPNNISYITIQQQPLIISNVKKLTTAEIIVPACQLKKCFAYRYYYEISSFDGTFTSTNNYLIANITKDKNLTYGSNGNLFSYYSYNDTIINNWISYFNFNYNCPLNPTNVNLLIKITAYNITRPPFIVPKRLRNLQSSNNNSANFTLKFDLSNLTENQTIIVYNSTLDFSLINSNVNLTQIVAGNIYRIGVQGQQEKLNNANITLISNDFPQCKNIIYNSNNGIFKSPALYILKSGLATNYKLQAQFNALTIYSTSLTVGGIAPSPVININGINLYDPSFNSPPAQANASSTNNTNTTNSSTNNTTNNTTKNTTNSTISNNTTINSSTSNSTASNSTTSNNTASNSTANNNTASNNTTSNSSASNSTANNSTASNSTASNNTANSASVNNSTSSNSSNGGSSNTNNSSLNPANNTNFSSNTTNNNSSTSNTSNTNANTNNNTNNSGNNNIVQLLTTSLSGVILNALDNTFVGGANIYLFTGTVILINQISNIPILPVSTSDNTLVNNFTSDINGAYTFTNLNFGTYTAIYQLGNFYREVKSIFKYKL